MLPDPSSDESNFDIPEGDDLDSIEIPSETAVAAPPVAAVKEGGAAPVVEAVTVPPVAPPTLAPVAAAPSALVIPPVTPVAAVAAEGQQAQSGPEPAVLQTFEQAFESNRVSLEAWMAEKLFALSEADRDELTTSADTLIPKMMAKVASTAISSVHRQIQQFVPQMIVSGVRDYLVAEKANSEAEGQFFAKWPTLKGQEEKVEPLLRLFVQSNPNATREQAIESVGLLAMHSLGLPLPGAALAPKTKTPQAPPFVPAGGGLPGSLVPTGSDEWAGFGLPNTDID